MTEFVLKHIFARDVLPYLQDIAELLHRIAQSGGRDYVSIVLQYALERGELRNKRAFFELINTQISSEVGEKIMTLAEQLIDEGMAKGLQQGLQKGKFEVAERLLSEGVELTFVAKMTGISLERLEALQEESF